MTQTIDTVCPQHGMVLPIQNACPWGCGHTFPLRTQPIPTVCDDLQRALEATTLFHLTEPRTPAGNDE